MTTNSPRLIGWGLRVTEGHKGSLLVAKWDAVREGKKEGVCEEPEAKPVSAQEPVHTWTFVHGFSSDPALSSPPEAHYLLPHSAAV